MEGLHSLSLHGNPWRCDCHLRPLIKWLMVANLPMVDLPRCKSPARLEDRRFADVSLEDFACTPELLSSPRYLEANVGEWREVSGDLSPVTLITELAVIKLSP